MSDLDVIKEIEQIIGAKLRVCPPNENIMDLNYRLSYILNKQQQVIGLSLKGSDFNNIDFLKSLPHLAYLNLDNVFPRGQYNINVLNSLTNLTQLDLSNNQINDINVLNNLINLTLLNLSDNQINDINALNNLTNLTELDLSSNKFNDITVLSSLTKLTTLYLAGNPQLSDINTLSILTNLTYLNLGGNKYSDITALNTLTNLVEIHLAYNELSNIIPLSTLTNLSILDLRHNQLKDINPLKILTNLVQLYLRENQINDITALNTLTNLIYLNLLDNKISDITPLSSLINLKHLILNHNQLKDISPLKILTNLTQLNLSNNQIEKIPEWLLNLNIPIKLEYRSENGVYLENNPLEQPPIEIIKQGNEAIRAYFQQLKKDGEDTIYEAKLILVGQSRAGKTSLANKIINANYQLLPEIESESTRGIDILRYPFPYKDKTFQTNIWDFGGQEIYHQTHQFFLTKRSLYFLLTDSRKENLNDNNHKKDKEDEEDEEFDLYYWLNTVSLLSNDSPLLIIKNEKENIARKIPESELKAQFNNIKDILATNLLDNRGLTKIIEAVQYQLSQLPHIGSALPKTWLKVRQKLEQDSRYYIRLDEYLALCQTNGFDNYEDKLQLSGYLHDLGVCLHFQEHSLLNKTVILKPTWATDAVYKVLDNDTVKTNYGRFNKSDLKTIWQNPDYQTMHDELLALMLNFKLCYEIPNRKNHYIAPQLLDKKPISYNWQSDNNLLLRYRYEFMPKGIISQFIVEMHESIANNYECVWQNGVVLEKDNSVIEIIEYYSKREIMIRAYGSNRKDLLIIVSHELDKINDSYKQLKDKCKKMIPCNCVRCVDLQEPHFYEEAVLKQFKEDKQDLIQCQKSYKMISVSELIDGFLIEKPETGQANNSIHQHIEKIEVIMGNKEENHLTAAENAQVQQFNHSNENTATQTTNPPTQEPVDNLFKKPLFYIGIAAFIYAMTIAWQVYDLQKRGMIGNKTYKEIISQSLNPITIIDSIFKDK